MFNRKTLIVVGAGASKEADLPTGHELKERIASTLDIRFEYGIEQISGDRLVCEAIRLAARRADPIAQDTNTYLRSAWMIHDAMPQAISIDNFIEAHQGDHKIELCGKLAIVREILEAERNSLLHVDTMNREAHPDFKRLEGTWFNAFMQLLTENCTARQLSERLGRVSLVVFNYDRCIEHFLYHSLQTYYGLDARDAAELVNQIEIYHPYGTVGALPWSEASESVEFGAAPGATQLLELSDQIKTFSESVDPESGNISALRARMAESGILLFLGFAFHRMNLELIRPDAGQHDAPEGVKYFGTAKGISETDCNVIIFELAALAGAVPENIALRNNLTCAQLFREFWRSLSLS